MAKHQTRKNGDDGRAETMHIRARRAAKYHVPPLDVKRLERELRERKK